MMEIITIEYKGLILLEPNMLLSNWVITMVCIVCIFQLRNLPAIALLRNYRKVFIMHSLGAFLGGLGHLLFHYTGQPFKAFAWIFIGIGTYYLQLTAIEFTRKPATRKALKIFSIVKLFLFIPAMFYFQSFTIVLADLALGLFIVVVPIHTSHYIQTRNKGSLLILVAVGIIIFSALFPVFRISINDSWFNFNDIGHLWMAISLYVIYLGAKANVYEMNPMR